MHARSGILQVSPDRVDDAVQAFTSNQAPKYKEANGYKGFVLLADRQSGKILGVSFWDSESDLQASDELGAAARSEIQESGGGSEEPVRETWEVVYDDMA